MQRQASRGAWGSPSPSRGATHDGTYYGRHGESREGRGSHGSERQPHIYGAQPHRYRQGTHVAGADIPPTWDPEQARDVWFPYTLREYMCDADRWCHATKVPPERRGPLLSLAVGGAARTIADDIDTQVLVRGATCDIRDGQGPQARTGPEMLFLHLLSRFPDNEEALMLRAGLEFFGFTPSRSEDIQVLMLRFDTMLERANA